MEDIFIASKKQEPADENKNLEKKEIQRNAALDTKIHLFSSFLLNPADISFENQEEDEKILLFVRKSKILNLKWILIASILFPLPLFVLPFVNLTSFLSLFPFKYIFYFTVLYFLVLVTYVYVNFITWYFNIALVTNLRLIDVDFSGLIYKNVAITKLSLVQDVSFTQVGVIRNMFNYGDILVQTAASLDNFIFEAAPNPEKASHTIENLIGKHGTV